MIDRFPASRQMFGATERRALCAIASAILTLSLWVRPTLAKDPFRSTNQHQIGDQTEAAFKAIFKDGNYTAAKSYLQQAESSDPKEPLVYAMDASLAYANKEVSLSSYSKKTLEAAQQLTATDPLRGNIYIAVGHFLQGATVIAREGTMRGTPQALTEIRQVYEYLDKAEAISSTDPELNLVRGYMDLVLAVSMPFSSPEQAIERLEKYASPRYLADRGLAIGYRDLGQYPKALESVDRALKATPGNPELFYLKAQILVKQGESQKNPALFREALKNFDEAIKPEKKAQLPAGLVTQIERERRRDAKRLGNPR